MSLDNKPRSSMGIRFYRWSSGSSQWQEMAEITSVDGPGKTRSTLDVTALNSVGGYRKIIGDLREGGSVSLGMNYTRATYEIMNDDFEDDDTQFYAIRIPDDNDTVLEIEGLVTELPISGSVGDKISADCTIEVSGKPDLYDGSSGWATTSP